MSEDNRKISKRIESAHDSPAAMRDCGEGVVCVIEQAAAQFVQPGDTIIMDAGTTVVKMVPHLAGITSLTVVINARNA